MKVYGIIFVILTFAGFVAPVVCRGEQGSGSPKDGRGRVSYSLGYQIGEDLEKQNTRLDSTAFLTGLKDALQGNDPRMEQEKMGTMLLEMKKKIVSRQKFEKQETMEQRHQAGKKFFEKNAKKADVIVLPSGVQYRVIRKGDGRKPGPRDRITVTYSSRLIDGKVFGSSDNKGGPQTFYVNGVVSGLTEALQLMAEGAHWEIFVPADLAYKRRGYLENRAVIFDLELLSTEPGE